MVGDRINDLCPNVPSTDETHVHDYGKIHSDSNQLQGSTCGRNAENVAAPSPTTPCAVSKLLYLCISTDH